MFYSHLLRIQREKKAHAHMQAHSTAYMIAACRPRTVLVDEIQFKRPVEVGDLLRFRSWVLAAWPTKTNSESSIIHVQVEASVVKPEALQSYETNTFNFLFSVDRRKAATGETLPLPWVLPVTEEQAFQQCAFYGPGNDHRWSRLGIEFGDIEHSSKQGK